MNIYSEYVFYSLSPSHTISIGRYIGLQLLSGTVVMLAGGLGSGKTTFVKGLADGLEVSNTEYVNSPTYNLIHQYTGRFTVYHVDLYRLNNSLDLDELGLIEVFDSEGVTFVEWPERINYRDLPSKRLDIKFNVNNSLERCIRVSYHGFVSILPI